MTRFYTNFCLEDGMARTTRMIKEANWDSLKRLYRLVLDYGGDIEVIAEDDEQIQIRVRRLDPDWQMHELGYRRTIDDVITLRKEMDDDNDQ